MLDRATAFETTRCMCLASRRAARRITRRFDHALRPYGLRATQFTLLSALYLAGPQSIGALADMLDAERTTVSRNLAVAEQNGWITLQADEDDARTRMARIAPPGLQLLERVFPAWRRTQAELVRDLGAGAAAGLHQLAGGPCVAPFPTPRTDMLE